MYVLKASRDAALIEYGSIVDFRGCGLSWPYAAMLMNGEVDVEVDVGEKSRKAREISSSSKPRQASA